MIKEFWQEVREEKKERKRLKKQRKKLALTGEQKATKIMAILFGVNQMMLMLVNILVSC